VDAMLND